MKYTLIFFLSMLMHFNTFGQRDELGKVDWLRDYDTALAQAESEDKPVLILFQEVPGCATCVNYGRNILSHPIIVDAIENEFVPLCVYNNKGGDDAKVLAHYGEPSWNNPVVRIVDSKGKDLMNRLAGNYSADGLINQMILSLGIAGKGQPEYLKLLSEELNAGSKKETAFYQMYCFWSGESHLGEVDGVVKTTPGWMNGAEVVKVEFDKSKTSVKELNKYASKDNCKHVKDSGDFRIDRDPQYYLKKSPYKSLALLDIQKTKINTAIASRMDPNAYLSPSQLKALKTGKKASLYELPIDQAWDQMISDINE